MYSFAQRPDTQVVDEPLYGHYLKVSGADHPGREEIMAHMDLDGPRVAQGLAYGAYHKPLVFFKNMAHHLIDLPQGFLSELTNIFLVRDPKEMLPSLINQIPDPKMLDTALEMQWELYQRLSEEGGHPLVIDSKELLLDPQKILTEACAQLNIPYYPEMIQWTAGARVEDGIWAKHWYHNVHKSTGFATYVPKEESVREDLLPLLEECSKHYQNLYQQALKA
jgi:hypothetical protein